jgi:hypothetical protein
MDDILKHLTVRRQVSDDLLESAVLVLQLTLPPHL